MRVDSVDESIILVVVHCGSLSCSPDTLEVVMIVSPKEDHASGLFKSTKLAMAGSHRNKREGNTCSSILTSKTTMGLSLNGNDIFQNF